MPRAERRPVKIPGGQYWGTIKSIDGPRIEIALRTGKLLKVDLSEAMKDHTTITPIVGRTVVISGELNAQGVLEARTIGCPNAAPKGWDPDSPK